MAKVWERTWTTNGVEKSAWVADYFDVNRKRRFKTFEHKKTAEAWLRKTLEAVDAGTHTPDSLSMTIAEAAEAWIANPEADRTKSTVRQYRQHIDHHIKPYIGNVKLSKFTVPAVGEFRRQLLAEGRSRVMVGKVMTSLRGIFGFAASKGLVGRNVVTLALADGTKGNKRNEQKERQRKRGTAKVICPTEDEIGLLIEKAAGRWRPLILTAVFTGMRASELRGLTWENVDLVKGEIKVRQRADAWNNIDIPKSAAGEREIAMPSKLVAELTKWKMECPRKKESDDRPGRLEYVFPNGAGNIESLHNIVNRGFAPLQSACGMTRPTGKKDENGAPILRHKYGLHALRHAAASRFIRSGKWTPKEIQTLMGHHSIQVTYDIYGHVFAEVEADKTEGGKRGRMDALSAHLFN